MWEALFKRLMNRQNKHGKRKKKTETQGRERQREETASKGRLCSSYQGVPPLFWSPHTDSIYLSFSAHALTSNPSGSLQASCLD